MGEGCAISVNKNRMRQLSGANQTSSRDSSKAQEPGVKEWPVVTVSRCCLGELERALEAIGKDWGFYPNCRGSHRGLLSKELLGTVSCFKTITLAQ